ncbi:radical SAM family heme chaperone HemW [Spiroplasma turonicum]|uniref:Heme chaperone HemW n=1 Tax=Spiroplasma turonicum TaxID=216946 RepID=A0A0K1P844_9MOLU|nr:radical SAM family heme chaperone HemW [Spiroplasma turonicum]AKU80047.1 coproporphyrinogen III oxidase [Spiroplasma turonicum]ALX71049.1 coproporphyrinogen III oxidase [Spiroplasma turonicum]
MKIWSIKKDIKSLYVHIPFCEHICFYCDFVKVKKPTKKEELIYEYLDKLELELNSYNDKLDYIQTIYIGGGTPSCLDNEQTIRMCKILDKYTKYVSEYSIELNPESVTYDKLKIYKKHNINRLSIGVQSFDNELLKKIGRVHDNSKAIEAYKTARKVGFNNISIDLMYNLFDQKPNNIYTDLDYISNLKPDHISWYSLIMKENSVWGKMKLKKPSNDEDFDNIVNNGLKDLDYSRYEISNYSLTSNKKSIHNLSYWNCDLFAGVGVGASGFEFINNNFYLTNNKGNYLKYNKEYELVSTSDLYFQIMMMGLRLIDGIDIKEGLNNKAYLYFQKPINDNIKEGLLTIMNNKLMCTARGINILNEILVSFL